MKTLNDSFEKETKTNVSSVNSKSQISEDAFYLIALAMLLKKSISPSTMRDYLEPGKFVAFKELSLN